MKIGIFMHAYLPKIGGAQITTHCLANSLISMGNEVTVYSHPDLVKSCKELGWEFKYNLNGLYSPPEILLKISPKLWLLLAKVLIKKVLVRNNIEAVLLVVAWPWLPIAKEIKNLGIKVAIRSAGDDIQVDKNLNYGLRSDPVKDNLIRNGFQNVSKAIAISETVTKEYLKVGIPKENIVEIVPGVDYNAYRNCIIKKSKVRDKWGIPRDKKVIISVGRNHPKKGFKDLILSLEFFKDIGNDNFTIVIVGKGTDELVNDAENIGQAHNYFPIDVLASFSENGIGTFPSIELIELYKASDYFVLPSYIETYANVAVEAMAAGIPAICTDAPGCIETINHKIDGLIIPTRSPEKIVEAVMRLENDHKLKQNIINQGHRRAEEQDWDNIAKEYFDLYETE